ncbi:MAG: FecR domain-containing protein, partial [Rhodothermales bacterium]
MPTSLPPEIQKSLAGRTPDDREALLQTWELLQDREPGDVPDSSDAWIDLKARVAQSDTGRAVDRSPLPGRIRMRRFVQIAATGATLVILVGIWAWMRPVVETAPPGTMVDVRLPDGSLAELNGGSEIQYNRRFGAWPFNGRRSLRLEGEAFFEVVPDRRPFVVTTSDAEIEVLGTR